MDVRKDGVDLSHFQNLTLSFAEAKESGLKFVYHKATESTNFIDGLHNARRTQVTAAGLPFGSYHFARPRVGGAVNEAKHFLSIAAQIKGSLVPMLDLENNDHGLTQAQLTEWVHDFCTTVQAVTNQKHGIRGFIYTPFNLNSVPKNWKLWRARYNDTLTPPHATLPFKRWTVWQFSNGVFPHSSLNQVPGIGHCDIDYLRTDDPDHMVKTMTIGYRRALPKYLVTASKRIKAKGRWGVKRIRETVKGTKRLKRVVKNLQKLGYTVSSKKK